MNINPISKFAILSIFSLGLATAPVIAASTSDTKSKISTTVKQNKSDVIKIKKDDTTPKAKKSHKMSDKVVNINKANKKQLISALNGIGEKKAQAIIDYRSKNGAFKSTKDLMNVKGIGQKIIDKNKANIALSGSAIVDRKGMSSMNDTAKKAS
jgi:comEA protein